MRHEAMVQEGEQQIAEIRLLFDHGGLAVQLSFREIAFHWVIVL